MSMTLSQFGSAAAGGYIYVTKADGTSIVSTFPNNYAAWGAVQEILGSSASLTSPTVLTDATYGFRVFGDTAGVLGVVSGTELTGYLVNRGAQSASYKVSVTLASNTLTTNRVSANMFVVLDTEGAGATDTLDHISIAGAVENDTICIVAASAARVITVTEFDFQIVLTNNANFVTGDGAQQIVLRYLNAVWCEVSRAGIVPTVAIQRAASIAIPVQGINSTAMGTSGTTTYVPGTDKGYQVITGSPVLAGGIVFTTGGSPIDGDEFVLDYRATPTLGGNTVTIFGITLTTTQAAQKCVITTKYKTSNTTWYSTLYVNGNAIDFATTTQLATKEPSLGNPAGNGFILSSETDGTRSWVPNPNGVIFTGSLTLSSADILALFTTPITIVPAQGSNKVIHLLDVVASNTFNTTAYAGANPLNVEEDSGGVQLWQFPNTFINTGASTINAGSDVRAAVVLTLTPNVGIQVSVPTANPTLGDGEITLSYQYRIIDFS